MEKDMVAKSPGVDIINVESDAESVQADDQEFDIEDIIAFEKRGRDRYWEVKWVGFDETTWEPYRNLKDLTPVFQEKMTVLQNESTKAPKKAGTKTKAKTAEKSKVNNSKSADQKNKKKGKDSSVDVSSGAVPPTDLQLMSNTPVSSSNTDSAQDEYVLPEIFDQTKSGGGGVWESTDTNNSASSSSPSHHSQSTSISEDAAMILSTNTRKRPAPASRTPIARESPAKRQKPAPKVVTCVSTREAVDVPDMVSMLENGSAPVINCTYERSGEEVKRFINIVNPEEPDKPFKFSFSEFFDLMKPFSKKMNMFNIFLFHLDHNAQELPHVG